MLYGCETWSLTLREECRLKLFENRFLGRIFGSKKGKNCEWRRHLNEELDNLYRSHIARREKGGSAFKILIGEPIGKRPLGRPRHR